MSHEGEEDGSRNFRDHLWNRRVPHPADLCLRVGERGDRRCRCPRGDDHLRAGGWRVPAQLGHHLPQRPYGHLPRHRQGPRRGQRVVPDLHVRLRPAVERGLGPAVEAELG
ncbi:MAG: hypothetical protein JWP06_484 [Candidatus Saccharibacteria bacterium]|nr:hypothetical protein [Candidatus Saccharibacteria bacterium]